MFPAGLCCLQLCSDLRSIDESSRLGRTHLVAMVHPCWYRVAVAAVAAVAAAVAEVAVAAVAEVAEVVLTARKFRRNSGKMNSQRPRSPQNRVPQPVPEIFPSIATLIHPESSGFSFYSR